MQLFSFTAWAPTYVPSPMPPRKAPDAGGLTPLEKRAHAAALAAPEHTLTGEDLALRLSDVPIEEQLLAINGLLKKSLFHAQKGPNGIQYVAVSKDEASLYVAPPNDPGSGQWMPTSSSSTTTSKMPRTKVRFSTEPQASGPK